MTFVIALASKNSIWLCTDRRLTAGRQTKSDEAVKAMVLEQKDGVALLGYAGLGKTAGGMEPSEWMANVVRGRNWPIENSLQAIADALTREMPRHLHPKALPGHDIVAVAIISNRVEIFALQSGVSPDGSTVNRFTRFETMPGSGRLRLPVYAFAGSGVACGNRKQHQREINRLLAAHDRQKIIANAVADRFAAFNFAVSKSVRTVGPNCVVLWRYRKGGGGVQGYTGLKRTHGPRIPHIGTGTDLGKLFGFILEEAMLVKRLPNGRPDLSMVDHNRAIAKFNALPTLPDEELK